MTVLFYAVIALHIIACLFLIAVVLLQQGKGGISPPPSVAGQPDGLRTPRLGQRALTHDHGPGRRLHGDLPRALDAEAEGEDAPRRRHGPGSRRGDDTCQGRHATRSALSRRQVTP